MGNIKSTSNSYKFVDSNLNCPATPMMKQYFSIKQDYKDCLLFYRMGDFYELFFDDAKEAAAILDIALTKRGKHLGDEIPMCGVPAHSHEAYLNKLIKSGYRVAICEQTEDPKKTKLRGHKAIVKRDVIRIITPGTITEDSLLSPRKNNYLMAIGESEQKKAIAWIDISTGQFYSQSIENNEVSAAVARINPGEIIISEGHAQNPNVLSALEDSNAHQTILSAVYFDSIKARKILKDIYNVSTLEPLGAFSKAELVASGAIVEYITSTQKGRVPRFGKLCQISNKSVLEIDAATRRNLELFSTLSGETKGSLISVIDKTITGPGARLLASRLAQPLTSPKLINARLDMVETFTKSDNLRCDLVKLLKKLPDIERSLSRLSLKRAGPRDLAAISHGLELASVAREMLRGEPLVLSSPAALNLIGGIKPHSRLANLLRTALDVELPLMTRDGGFIRKGYLEELDNLLELRDEGRRLIISLEQKYAKLTNLPKLKVKHNNVLGYFVEVSPKNAEKVVKDGESPFIHRQTLSTAVRYSTIELSELESKISHAAEQVIVLEVEIFETLSSKVLTNCESIASCAQTLAELDVYVGLAVLAIENKYTRPVMEDSTNFRIENGRHPVVESISKSEGKQKFIKNSCHLSGKSKQEEGAAQIWLLSGPNMAGKSTFLRQCALITIMAQMGSYIPADSAKIGVVDRLFSRVGASDDLARGRSTFMVEMVETAIILNQAGPRSLVILDEIGRGTATFDGLSIAWAVIEYLHEKNHCRTLFATHYHELTALSASLGRLKCYTMKVKEWKNDIVFLHEVISGAAHRSYGIHVGSLAGLPEQVVARSKQILKLLEEGGNAPSIGQLTNDLPLFNVVERKSETSILDNREPDLEAFLKEIDLDNMTPNQAHNLLYELKSKIFESPE